MLHCRAALFLSDLADPTSVVSEYETLLALEPQRFFCDDWPIISRALCEQSYAPLPDHAALSALQMELMQATISGSLSPLVLRTLELLTQRHDQTVYVSAIAAELGVTDSHLSRSFKQQLGIGIAEYIRYVRVYAAAAELCTGDARIRDVAEHHGFSDSKYFSKVFHQVLGLTPSQWLQRHAQSSAAQEVLA